MPRIITMRSKDETDRDVVSLVLSQDALSIGPDGDPWSGVTLNAEQARSLAKRLASIATEIENQEEQGYRTSSLSFVHLTSIAVMHDGSQQGHRAVQAALEFASRSLGALELLGIFGLHSQSAEPSSASEDYEWQRGWLSRLADMYGEQARLDGVSFHSRLCPRMIRAPCWILSIGWIAI